MNFFDVAQIMAVLYLIAGILIPENIISIGFLIGSIGINVVLLICPKEVRKSKRKK
jgi:hypothetical protein